MHISFKFFFVPNFGEMRKSIREIIKRAYRSLLPSKRVKTLAHPTLKTTRCDLNVCVKGSGDGYVYLLREREFVKTQEPVYKIGKTINFHARLHSYPKDSHILAIVYTANMDGVEKQLIKTFKEVFVHRVDVGHEYFEGKQKNMLHRYWSVVQSHS